MLYHLSEEHEMLRQFVREFAESQLAPNAAEVDDKGVFCAAAV
ncbi:butyryl-CoA dehydrogenase [Cutibacterium acnes JCM 18918]|nr:butyryl-CoA dehydrogenase [Cutibacterium acnes JCM 18918]